MSAIEKRQKSLEDKVPDCAIQKCKEYAVGIWNDNTLSVEMIRLIKFYLEKMLSGRR